MDEPVELAVESPPVAVELFEFELDAVPEPAVAEPLEPEEAVEP